MAGENAQILTNRPLFGARIDFSHPLTKGLVGCWLLNDQGQRAMDISPYQRHGTLTGFSSPVKRPHNGLRFDGISSYIDLKYSHNTVTASRYKTIVAWVSSDTLAQPGSGNEGRILTLYRGSGLSGFSLMQMDNPGYWKLAYMTAGTTLYRLTSGIPVKIGRPTFLAGIQDGVKIRFHVDGQITTKTDAAAPTMASPSNSTIGCFMNVATPNLFFGGKIFLALIYNIPLSKESINNLYLDPYCFVLG
jgi:hypothetical protein